jgi:hypothetical protein
MANAHPAPVQAIVRPPEGRVSKEGLLTKIGDAEALVMTRTKSAAHVPKRHDDNAMYCLRINYTERAKHKYIEIRAAKYWEASKSVCQNPILKSCSICSNICS